MTEEESEKDDGVVSVTAGRAPAGEASGDQDRSLRVRLDLAYDGTGFSGWAAQPGLRTVEGELTRALTTVLRVPVRLTVAGRTDSGVHAAAQVAHVDVPADVWASLPGRSRRCAEQALMSRLAGVLARQAQEARQRPGQPRGRGSGRGEPVVVSQVPRGASDLVVTGVSRAPEGFDARFSALWRRYTYRVSDALGPRDPRRRDHVLWSRQVLDVEAMDASMAPLLGEHDFLSFCRPRQGATTVRRLREVCWRREPQGEAADAGLVTLSVIADAFCHSMVRSLVGAGLEVGAGRQPDTWPQRLLALRSRQGAAPVAPPHGLTLEEVRYPPPEEVEVQARRARRRRGGC